MSGLLELTREYADDSLILDYTLDRADGEVVEVIVHNVVVRGVPVLTTDVHFPSAQAAIAELRPRIDAVVQS